MRHIVSSESPSQTKLILRVSAGELSAAPPAELYLTTKEHLARLPWLAGRT